VQCVFLRSGILEGYIFEFNFSINIIYRMVGFRAVLNSYLLGEYIIDAFPGGHRSLKAVDGITQRGYGPSQISNINDIFHNVTYRQYAFNDQLPRLPHYNNDGKTNKQIQCRMKERFNHIQPQLLFPVALAFPVKLFLFILPAVEGFNEPDTCKGFVGTSGNGGILLLDNP